MVPSSSSVRRETDEQSRGRLCGPPWPGRGLRRWWQGRRPCEFARGARSVTKVAETEEFGDNGKSTTIGRLCGIPEQELGQLKQEGERSDRAFCVDRCKEERERVAFACSTEEPRHEFHHWWFVDRVE